MNLLILGAGGHGNVVRETALTDKRFGDISFLDDVSANAVGTISEYKKMRKYYPAAFVGIGNNQLRMQLIEMLREADYDIVTLIHPLAYVSPSAGISKGTIVEPYAIINTNSSIGSGCIISVGSIVEHDSRIGNCCHINSGAIVRPASVLPDLTRVDSGVVYG